MELPYATVTVVAGLLSATAGIVALQRPGDPNRARYPFVALCAAGAVWGIAYGGYLHAAAGATLGAILRLAWVGAVPFAPLWFLFVAGYVGDDRWFAREALALLFLLPAVTLAVLLAGDPGGLLFAAPEPTTAMGYAVLSFAPGPLLSVHATFAVWLLAVSAVRLADVATRTEGVSRRVSTALAGATLIPAVTLTTVPLGLSVAPEIDLTPAALGAANALVLLALLHYGLFDPDTLSRMRLFDETADAVVAVGTDGRVTTANPAARSLFADGDPVAGRQLAALVPDPAPLRPLVEGDRRRTSLAIPGDDGPRYLEVTATSLGDAEVSHGELLVMQDVTERRLLETTFRRVVENTSDVVSVVTDGDLTYVSPTAADAFGYAPEALMGEPLASLVHPEDRATVEDALDRATATGEPTRVNYRFRPHAGGWRTVESVVVDLRDDPAVDGYVFTTRDVTDRREREQRLRVLNRMLRHDLRNDMNVVLGYLDRYLAGDGTEADLDRARSHADDLLELGKRAREMDEVLGEDAVLEGEDAGTVDLRDVVEDEVRRFRDRYPDATLSVDVEVDPVIRSPDGFGLAIRHLLDNSVEHHDRPDPTVWLDLRSAGPDAVEVVVADDGPGIPDAELGVIRTGTETPLEHGSGVGLWLVQWIAENAGGDVSFERGRPRGTVVRMELPTTGEPASARTVEGPGPADPDDGDAPAPDWPEAGPDSGERGRFGLSDQGAPFPDGAERPSDGE